MSVFGSAQVGRGVTVGPPFELSAASRFESRSPSQSLCSIASLSIAASCLVRFHLLPSCTERSRRQEPPVTSTTSVAWPERSEFESKMGVKEFAAKYIIMASPNVLRAINPRHNPTQDTLNRLLKPFKLRLSLAPLTGKPRRTAA